MTTKPVKEEKERKAPRGKGKGVGDFTESPQVARSKNSAAAGSRKANRKRKAVKHPSDWQARMKRQAPRKHCRRRDGINNGPGKPGMKAVYRKNRPPKYVEA